MEKEIRRGRALSADRPSREAFESYLQNEHSSVDLCEHFHLSWAALRVLLDRWSEELRIYEYSIGKRHAMYGILKESV